MIVQSKETKAKASLIDLLGGSGKSKSGKTNETFSQLLSSLSSAAKGEKIGTKQSDFTTVIDPKSNGTLTKSDAAKTAETRGVELKKPTSKALEELLTGKEDERKMFPKEMLDALSNDQVHSLIHKAKTYLKNAIMTHSSELPSDPKTLPKTLMGLVELADKLGINLSEITLSTIDNEADKGFKELSSALLSKPLLDLKKALPENPSDHSHSFEAFTQRLSEAKASQFETKTAESETKLAKEPTNTSDHPLQSLLKGFEKGSVPVTEPSKEVSKELPKIATAPSATDPLIMLLQGNKESDAPLTETKEDLKALNDTHKTHQAHKADSLELKNKEAVQSMRHFAIDLKEAAENYKPPFTRIAMKLNPQALGEVDVTLIQRGNNVHVTIQSANTNSVAFLAHNATELKAQLAHQGITNATMNFMAGSESQQQPGQQQHQQQNRFRAYASFEELELGHEELSALEIIIPHYA